MQRAYWVKTDISGGRRVASITAKIKTSQKYLSITNGPGRCTCTLCRFTFAGADGQNPLGGTEAWRRARAPELKVKHTDDVSVSLRGNRAWAAAAALSGNT